MTIASQLHSIDFRAILYGDIGTLLDLLLDSIQQDIIFDNIRDIAGKKFPIECNQCVRCAIPNLNRMKTIYPSWRWERWGNYGPAFVLQDDILSILSFPMHRFAPSISLCCGWWSKLDSRRGFRRSLYVLVLHRVAAHVSHITLNFWLQFKEFIQKQFQNGMEPVIFTYCTGKWNSSPATTNNNHIIVSSDWLIVCVLTEATNERKQQTVSSRHTMHCTFQHFIII